MVEMLAYSISNLGNNKKAMMLLGPPNVGKSVLLKLTARVLGEEWVVPLSMSDIVHRFNGSLMEDKKLVVAHEMVARPLKDLHKLKAVISGDPIIVERKFVQGHGYTPNVKIIMAANNLPLLGEPDVGGAFSDRLAILQFAQSVKERNPNLLEEIWEERDILFSIAVNSMKDFIARGMTFSPEPESDKLVEKLKLEGNSTDYFINVRYESKADCKICLADFYEDYAEFCKENLLRAVSKDSFRSQLLQLGFEISKHRVGTYPNPRSCIVGLAKKIEKIAEQSK